MNTTVVRDLMMSEAYPDTLPRRGGAPQDEHDQPFDDAMCVECHRDGAMVYAQRFFGFGHEKRAKALVGAWHSAAPWTERYL